MLRLWKINTLIMIAISAFAINPVTLSAEPLSEMNVRQQQLLGSEDPRRTLRLTGDTSFLVALWGEIPEGSPPITLPIYSGCIVSSSLILTYYQKFSPDFCWTINCTPLGNILAFAGSSGSFQYRTIKPSNVAPFVGRMTETSADINTYFKNSLALAKVDSPFTVGTDVRPLRIATDLGLNLVNKAIPSFSTAYVTADATSDIGFKLETLTWDATSVIGSDRPPHPAGFKGTLDKTTTMCISVTTNSAAACIQGKGYPDGTPIVVLGADNEQYLVGLTRLQRNCEGTDPIQMFGTSVLYPGHSSQICQANNGVVCGQLQPTTTEVPQGMTDGLLPTTGKWATIWSFIRDLLLLVDRFGK